jgi:lysyl-tRNA synthetase class 2
VTEIAHLKARARIVRDIRAFFDARGFVEVETPVRIPAPAPEPHIDCPASGAWFLRASPELQMKKLLAEGLPRIYQIGPCFREGESGRRHAPEFTMLEW